MDLTEIDMRDGVDAALLDDLMTLYTDQWWTAQRTQAQVETMLETSSLVVAAVHRPTGQLVGFTRVVTDHVFYAVVLDVIVAVEWRLHGLGSRLVEHVVTHPMVAAVESVELSCQPHLLPFYRRWGFTERVGASRLMRRTSNPAFLGEPPD